jgi:NAD(P)-dependent dehydrogenase (short-subunit alcohol dehydrogenase family)
VNNAGSLIARTRVLDFTPELWEKVMMLNLTSAFFVSQAVLKGMVERKHGIHCECVVGGCAVRWRTGCACLCDCQGRNFDL